MEYRNTNLIGYVFGRILLPALLAGASANLAGMIDGIIVGNIIGSGALAAVNACRPAMQVYGFLSEIFASGLANCIAASIGRNEKDNADRVFTAGMLAASAAAVILTLLQFAFAREICMVLADDAALFPLALQYYRWFLFSVFFILVSEPLAAVMRSDGMPLMSGIVLLLPHVINAVLDLLLLKVFGMGLAGAAIATVLGYLAGFLICCHYFLFRRSYRLSRGGLRKNLAEITSVGLPPAVGVGLVSVKLLIVNRLALSAGGMTGMAALSMLMVAWAVQSLFIGGVRQAMIPMISFYYGNGDYHGVRAVFWHACRILLGLAAALLLFFALLPQTIPFLFGMRDPEELACAATAIRIFALYLPLDSLITLVITYYTSSGNKKTAALLSVLQGLAATVLVIYPLVHFFGLIGVWLSFPVAGLVPAILVAVMSHGNSERFFRMKGHTYLKEFSLDYSKISRTVESVIKAVCDAGFDKSIANRTGIAIEEMAVSAFERNKGKRLHVDVTVRKIGETLLVTFADDGAEFNPLEYRTPDGKEPPDNVTMLKAVSRKIEYGRVIGMNKIDVILESSAEYE